MATIQTIAVDARTLTYRETAERGIGAYSIAHIHAWAETCPEIHFRFLTEKSTEFVKGQELLRLPNVSADHYSLSQKEFSDVDLFHIPDPMSIIEGFDSPCRMAPAGIRRSAVFYDLIPLALRQSIYDNWPVNLQRAYDSRLQHLKETGTAILAISECTRKDLIRFAAIPADRIAIIMAGLKQDADFHPSADQIARARESLNISKPYLLVVGSIDQHKGFMQTLEASLDLLKSNQMQLVVAGSMLDPWKRKLQETLRQQGIDNLIFTGFISEHDLSCLYAGALALVFPSEYEGFGFPVLEAMAHGCPVICSKEASLPEVAGNAALYLQDRSAASIFQAIKILISNPDTRNNLIVQGRQRASLFSWQEVAKKTMNFIKD